MSARRRPLLAGAAATVVAASLVLLARSSGALEALDVLERWTLDVRFALRGPEAPVSDVVIVAFDDKTDARDPTLFTKRASWARLVDELARHRPRAIGIDGLFAEEEALLDRELTRDIEHYLDELPAGGAAPADALLARVHAALAGDEALAASIARAGNVVLALHLGARAGASSRAIDLSSSSYGQAMGGADMPAGARSVVTSLPAFARAARAQGMITTFAHADHSLRELLMARRHDGAVIAPFSVHLAAAALGISREQLGYAPAPPTLHLGARALSVGERHSLVLNYRGPPGAFPTYSVVDVLEGKLPPGALEGRVVLVGYTHLSHDTTRTPFGQLFPGVEVHATAVDNLLAGDPVRRAPAPLDFALALAVGLVVSLLFSSAVRLEPARRVAAACAAVVVALACVHGAFALADLWISATGPLFAGSAALLASVSASYLAEGRERARIRRAFAHYLSDDVIAELLRDPSRLSLGGARREVTVLFSDIRGFTTMAEEREPLELVRFLNRYLTPMTRAVLDGGGYLDKYVGDAVMAVFGAPLPAADHVDRALSSALAMHAQLGALRARYPDDDMMRELAIGVGLNSGDVVVGNLGSDERFDYTVIGDAVNLASRLEGLTKSYGAFCLVGDETRRRASAVFRFREVDLVQVKGRRAPVPVHELLAGPGYVVVELIDLEAFARGLSCWRAGRFAEARACFGAFREQNPRDPVVALYLARLDELGDVVPEGWDGVYVQREK